MTQKLFYPQINTCYTVPCASTGENECLWTDWLLDNSLNGEQARQYACIRRSDTTCSWYRGGPPPEKDFLDMADPWPVILTFILLHFTTAKSWETYPAFAYVAQIWHASSNWFNRTIGWFSRESHYWASVCRVQVVAKAMLGISLQTAGVFNLLLTQTFLPLTHSTSLAVFHRIGIAAHHPLQIHPRVNLFFISDGLFEMHNLDKYWRPHIFVNA